jgi:hypothetical protein
MVAIDQSAACARCDEGLASMPGRATKTRMTRPGREGRSRARDAVLAGREARSRSGLRYVAGFLRATQKWWLAPIIVGLLLLGLALALGGTAVAPFIYSPF